MNKYIIDTIIIINIQIGIIFEIGITLRVFRLIIGFTQLQLYKYHPYLYSGFKFSIRWSLVHTAIDYWLSFSKPFVKATGISNNFLLICKCNNIKNH